jgi:hypothetical protein
VRTAHVEEALNPRSVTVLSSTLGPAQALEALLCDSGIPFRASRTKSLEALASENPEIVVCFVRGFEIAELLRCFLELHARRPSLPLLFIADKASRWALWQAFEGSPLPPTVLRETAPAVVIRDAIRLVGDTCVVESAATELEPDVRKDLVEQAVLKAIRTLNDDGPPLDYYFDRFLPARLRAASSQFWTPLEVVKRAASWLDDLGADTVVDIGSGVGKFCVAGALTSGCSFVGIEHRPDLAAVARNLALLFSVEQRVSIVDSPFDPAKTPAADCYYAFNPFEENLLPHEQAIDAKVELNADRFRREVRSFRTLVASLPLGAHVLTYNGVGGRLPECLAEKRVDKTLPAVLRLFEKVRC